MGEGWIHQACGYFKNLGNSPMLHDPLYLNLTPKKHHSRFFTSNHSRPVAATIKMTATSHGLDEVGSSLGVDGAVGERGEEDKCSALSWLQLEPEHVEARAAAHGHIVAVDEHSARPRPARLD